MKARLRKLGLTAHITFAVGWLGAVVAYLALAIVGLSSSCFRGGATAHVPGGQRIPVGQFH